MWVEPHYCEGLLESDSETWDWLVAWDTLPGLLSLASTLGGFKQILTLHTVSQVAPFLSSNNVEEGELQWNACDILPDHAYPS